MTRDRRVKTAIALLAVLALSGCGTAGTASMVLAFQVVDDALGVSKAGLDLLGVRERVKLAETRCPAAPTPEP